jgi:hypothetical protein
MSSSGINGLDGARSPCRYCDEETVRIVVSPRNEKEKEAKAQLYHGLGVRELVPEGAPRRRAVSKLIS